MEYDFDKLPQEDPYALVPEGRYLCRIADVRARKARDGSEQWGIRLEAVGGEQAGRTLAWDNLTWSERGAHRVQAVLGALGIDASGRVSLEPEDLVDLRAVVTLQVEEYQVAERIQRRMAVPYQGYDTPGEVDLDDAPLPAAMPF